MVKRGAIGDLFRFELRAARERNGLTLSQLADMVNKRVEVPIYYSTIAKIERGEREVRVDELVALADVFGVSVDALLGRAASGTDVAWATSRLSSEAQKMIADVISMSTRLETSTQELINYADRDHKRAVVAPITTAAVDSINLLRGTQVALRQVAGEFPLPGVNLDRG